MALLIRPSGAKKAAVSAERPSRMRRQFDKSSVHLIDQAFNPALEVQR
jgi:hypothetical protein